MLSYITWTFDPDLISVGPFTVRWYGLMWALGFFIGYHVESKIYKNEGLPPEAMERLLYYMIFGTIIGARIGHCFFYDWEYYSNHLLELFCIWKGGLSSHGGAFGILTAMWLFRKTIQKSYIWVLDRIVIAVAICGACIRMGNLFNHEIYGNPTDVPWAFRFVTNIGRWQNGMEPIFSEPSHPTQIYEVLYCDVTFSVLLYLYWKTDARKYEGFLFGVFLIGIFFTRFLLEFIKENQVAFENDMVLNMGQLLSVPFFVVGFYLLFRGLLQMRKDRKSKSIES